MKALFQIILACFVGESRDELAHQIAYLKIENEILRSKLPDRIDLTAQERNRLLKYGKLVGSALARLADEGIEAVKVGPRAPNLNAHCERWVLSLRSEVLDHFMVFGERHLQYIINSYVEYYNKCRPHQGVGNVPLQAGESEPVAEGEIICHEWLGGKLKHYERKAA